MIKKLRYIILLSVLLVGVNQARGQNFAVRGNMLALLTGTINAGVSYDFHPKWQVDLALAVNPIKTPTFSVSMLLAQPGVRYWFREVNYSHFISAYVNVGTYDFLFNKYSYKGFAFGPGVSWGYYFPIKKRINIGVEIGVGVLFATDKNQLEDVPETSDLYVYQSNRVIFAPTKAEVSFVYLF